MPTTSTDTFYSALTPVKTFKELTDAGSYTPLPDDWCIAIADVVNSTGAIAAGNYKAVNTVGVSVIAAITNALKPVEVPYVFGGDGALVCLPGTSFELAKVSLAATAAMSRQSFGLELRGAVVPVSYIRQQGHDVLLGRQRVSAHYDQCALYGGGAMFVERQLKSGNLPAEFQIVPDGTATADYSGLECRWNEVPSPEDEIVAVIIDASLRPERSLETYREAMARITEIYGEADRWRPVTEEGLKVSLSSRALSNESRVRTWKNSTWMKLKYALMQRIYVVMGWFFFRFSIRTSATDWSVYKSDLVANTDCRKFDGSLRLVLSGNMAKRRALEDHLEQRALSGDLVYGIHVAQSAIMTCLISQRQHEHVHFVDASGGGYAEAAKTMKMKIKEIGEKNNEYRI